jgi:hypothetical protein
MHQYHAVSFCPKQSYVQVMFIRSNTFSPCCHTQIRAISSCWLMNSNIDAVIAAHLHIAMIWVPGTWDFIEANHD